MVSPVPRRIVTPLLLGLLIACRPEADEGFTLLFLGRSPAARVDRLSWAADAPRSRLVAFDGDLQVARTLVHPRIAQPAAVAPFPAGRLLVTERTGEAVVFDTNGSPLREWEGPFSASLYAANGSRIVASRSPYFVLFQAEEGDSPLLWILDTLGRRLHGVGTIHVPEGPGRYFAQLVNAGSAVGTSQAIYFAPLIRDEVLRLDETGSPVWRFSRGMIPVERDPYFVGPAGARRAIHALVNIAMAIGPPDSSRLYILGADDSAATKLRLDVLDLGSGGRVAQYALGTAATAVAVDRRGSIRVLDPESLLAQTPVTGRERFTPPFALPDLSGTVVKLDDYRGKVTLVNFWASWCDPCREEFPHMAELYHDLADSGFAIAAISDDVNERSMRAFVREFRPLFPILVGRGRMKATYHYRGLPYSVLLDREGRVIERIFGFGGDAEFRRLRATIVRELHADTTARH